MNLTSVYDWKSFFFFFCWGKTSKLMVFYVPHSESRFGFPDPIYINVVRDPVERVISWFYYVRAPWYYVERKRAFPELPLPDPEWLKKDFETCVLTSDPECVYTQGARREGIGDHRRQTLFFCGHEPDCTYVTMPFQYKIIILFSFVLFSHISNQHLLFWYFYYCYL